MVTLSGRGETVLCKFKFNPLECGIFSMKNGFGASLSKFCFFKCEDHNNLNCNFQIHLYCIILSLEGVRGRFSLNGFLVNAGRNLHCGTKWKISLRWAEFLIPPNMFFYPKRVVGL